VSYVQITEDDQKMTVKKKVLLINFFMAFDIFIAAKIWIVIFCVVMSSIPVSSF
jgi:hypothetical protein